MSSIRLGNCLAVSVCGIIATFFSGLVPGAVHIRENRLRIELFVLARYPCRVGKVTIHATATDLAGNISASSAPFDFVVDNHASQITFFHYTTPSEIAKHDGMWLQTDEPAQITVYENGVRIADNSHQQTSSPLLTGFGLIDFKLSDGLHPISFTLTDAVGNTAESSTGLLLNVRNGGRDAAAFFNTISVVLPKSAVPSRSTIRARFKMYWTWVAPYRFRWSRPSRRPVEASA